MKGFIENRLIIRINNGKAGKDTVVVGGLECLPDYG